VWHDAFALYISIKKPEVQFQFYGTRIVTLSRGHFIKNTAQATERNILTDTDAYIPVESKNPHI